MPVRGVLTFAKNQPPSASAAGSTAGTGAAKISVSRGTVLGAVRAPPPSGASPSKSPECLGRRSAPGHRKSPGRFTEAFDRRTADPFSGGSGGRGGRRSGGSGAKVVRQGAGGGLGSTLFTAAYNRRDLPCRLVHGSVTHTLVWDVRPEDLPYDPLLVTLAHGLTETRHPYYFVARRGFDDLLKADGAGARAAPLVQRLVPALRATLLSRDNEVYRVGLDGLVALSHAVGPALTPHLKQLVGQLAKNVTKRGLRDQITETLNVLEANGGDPCYKLIKAKIPTYCTVSIGLANGLTIAGTAAK